MSNEQTCPYPWCTSEKSVPCTDSGATTSHYGPSATINAGDDQVSVQVLGLPGHGPGPDVHDVYIEITTTELLPNSKRSTSSTFLALADTDGLIAALTTARAAVAAGPT